MFLYETEYTVSSLWVAAQQKAAAILTWQWTKQRLRKLPFSHRTLAAASSNHPVSVL